MNKNAGRGIGFFGLLQLIFIALKVAGVINWSWILVFIPTYSSIVLWITALIILMLILK